MVGKRNLEIGFLAMGVDMVMGLLHFSKEVDMEICGHSQV